MRTPLPYATGWIGAAALCIRRAAPSPGRVGSRARNRLHEYSKAGKAKFVPAARFADDERSLRADADLRSDDPHVLALARAARVRLLYTGDKDLMVDFKKFIDGGNIYSRAANANLLTSSACAAPAQRRGRKFRNRSARVALR